MLPNVLVVQSGVYTCTCLTYSASHKMTHSETLLHTSAAAAVLTAADASL